MKSARRVVVTGLGMVTPLGNDVKTTWQNIVAGQSGVVLMDKFDIFSPEMREYKTQIAALVKDFDPTQYVSQKDLKKMDIFITYGIAAGFQAWRDSGLEIDEINAHRMGVSMSSGIGGITTIEATRDILLKNGPRRVSPFCIPAVLINLLSGHLSIELGLKGPNLAIVTACTTGSHNIGQAARVIAYGDADVMLAGGAEKASTPIGLSGFAAARALSSRNDDPEGASRPWDRDRDGFVLGDGAGALMLEEYEHAKARGANIYAELVGFGMSGDAYHMTSLSEDGAARCIHNALGDAGLSVDAVDYLNAHGTSTPAGDVAESNAIELAFGEHAKRLSVSSTKSMTGHLLGAAGAIEAIFSVLAIRDQVVPPTINLHNVDERCRLDYTPLVAKERNIDVVLSNSFGFGGTNGSLVFKRI